MKTFTQWLENVQSSVQVDDREFRSEMQEAAKQMIYLMHDRAEKVRAFQPEQYLQKLKQELSGYPGLNQLLQALQSKQMQAIFDQQTKLRDWIMQQDYRATLHLRDISRDIFTYLDSLDQNQEVDESGIQQLVQQAVQGTIEHMAGIKAMIEEAISRITNWNGSPVTIKPASHSSEFGGGVDISPTSSALVYTGRGEYAPYFSLFQDLDDYEGIVIDDVLEGGDDDFFQSPQMQADYFSLIGELRNPGSTNKGKVLTLYTARPKSDREDFMQRRTLPTNVFLANNYDHVEGLAHDLSSGEPRDVWKVRIDSRYLTQTLDGPIKYYQITAQNAPVLKLELL